METPIHLLKPMSGDIERLAYSIWEKEGKPHGLELEHWLQAESLLTTTTQVKSPVQVVAEVEPLPLPKPKKQKKGKNGGRAVAKMAA